MNKELNIIPSAKRIKESRYHDSIMNILKPHGPITSRAMFGGYGIYYEKAMFACIVENELYFRINTEIESFFDEYRSKQFVYVYPDGKSIKLPYKTLPETILNNENQLRQWILRSYHVALQAKLKKQTKSKNTINLSEL